MRLRDISIDRHELGDLAPLLLRWAVGAAVLGVVGAAALVVFGHQSIGRFLQSYLVSFTYFLSLSLGALFFVLLHHVTRAGWSVVVRRLAEGMAVLFPVLAVLAVPILLGMHDLYSWSRPGATAHDSVLAGKAGYLNPTFFVIRLAVYFAAWWLLGRYFFKRSVEQDRTGDPNMTVTLTRRSAPGMVLYAFAVNFCAFDLLMSLDPHWFSTIFGVYLFSSSVVGFLAVLPHVTHWLQHHKQLLHSVTIEHFHDMGKLLFAFIVFWAYIAFSQYMLMWYGNMPEETEWYLKRQTGGWTWVSLLLVFGHFLIPFLVLIFRGAKRNVHVLLIASAWVALMHWVDIYWLIVPELSPSKVSLGLMDLFCMLAVGGVYAAAWVLKMRRHSLVPVNDPRLAESLAFENA